MANPKNLRPQAHVLTVEEQSMGGKISAQKRKERKMFKDALLALLESDNGKGKNYQDSVVVGLVKRAATGDPRAVELMLRIIGEEPERTEEQKTTMEKLDAMLEEMRNAVDS